MSPAIENVHLVHVQVTQHCQYIRAELIIKRFASEIKLLIK